MHSSWNRSGGRLVNVEGRVVVVQPVGEVCKMPRIG